MKFVRWYDAIARCQQRSDSYVIATVMGSAGSVPRDPGSKMVITAQDQFDTLGGGQLEFQLIQKARAWLAETAGTVSTQLSKTGPLALQKMEKIPLAAKAGQCCGGSVSVLLELFQLQTAPLVVFGAGHVAKALMNILGGLEQPVIWVDNRAEQFPPADTLAANIDCVCQPEPVDMIAKLPAGSELVILTHNHQLDFELLQAALARTDFRFIGCIGSQTKTERFALRLQHAGLTAEQLAQLTMPIGLPQVGGKLPMEVAVSVAAQLLARKTSAAATDTEDKARRKGLSWKQLQEGLTGDALTSSEHQPVSHP
ncbi:xanthine dehydrogenase accessory protein XdhC [Thalassolituus sp. C2-1]|uniref:xanthine dehydrogenase accessory protein XdhC n=1 Tax=Venatorbacter sp. C2-1 TaxID=2597518 RepID=UPI001197171A|nr:xanthine dehydrogenase accessory protein XdhC [Thalassolituus sp. C2-1]TVV45829.1 xanthine dehydrogenase accessory protein XdhC [Thalassolituus sp. C2-1]